VDETLEGKEEEMKEEEQAQEGEQPKQAGQGTATAEDMALYTKYDFIPGDKVIFYDDMKGDEEGEFPRRWNLEKGVFEVVRLGSEYWIMCTDKGSVRPKIQDAPLPPKYTVEVETYSNGTDKSGHWFDILWLDSEGEEIGRFHLRNGSDTQLYVLGQEKASKGLPEKLGKGIHVMRIMATTQSIKCYVDNERVANVPQVENFHPVGFKITTDPWVEEGNPLLFRGFRFAEGGKTMREQLDETGRVVTHGILFDVNSAKIKAESYKTLQEIGQLLQDDPTLRLSIEGHTDSDGTDEHNLTLSQDRANSVRDYLVSTNKIETSRLEAKGWGESKPVDTNDTAEGKANNRRVELVKL
jgi:OOP family OmpA-OmpF porin